MKFIIKLFPEIMIKSESVRRRFAKILTSNIRNIITKVDETATVVRHWDYIEVNSADEHKRDNLTKSLAQIPGIHHFLEVGETTFTSLHDIFEQTIAEVGDKLNDKTFCVRAKRKGKHEFNSLDVEKYVGGGLNQHIASAKVKLKNPDVVVNIEIDNNKLLQIKQRHKGLGGYPVGTQEQALMLISGGFDSGVASYMMIRRGVKLHYCFFNLGGDMHEFGVKEMAYLLWQKFSSSHRVNFFSVDFAPVVTEILNKVDNAYMGVVLKRMMLRAASDIAHKHNYPALITGEAIGQVSSQTLANLEQISKASDKMVLRPLIAHDKEDIIDIARKIGTSDISEAMPEYCGVISNKPTVCADEEKLLAEEQNFDFNILDKCASEALKIDIRDLKQNNGILDYIPEVVTTIGENQQVVDIRSNFEIEQNPLDLADKLEIEFFKLKTELAKLDANKTYLLYCEQGVMSKMQCVYLKQHGFNNLKVYLPK